MILERILVKSGWDEQDPHNFTNCYLVGSSRTQEVFIIDPGGELDKIVHKIEHIQCHPIAIILTHAHIDHTNAVAELKAMFHIPLMYHKKELECFRRLRKLKADRWITENDMVTIDHASFHIIETAGHSPGSISLYTKDITRYEGKEYDGIIFTGDLLFKHDIGRSDIRGGDRDLLYHNLRGKIFQNGELSDHFLVLPGHGETTTIGEEKAFFRNILP